VTRECVIGFSKEAGWLMGDTVWWCVRRAVSCRRRREAAADGDWSHHSGLLHWIGFGTGGQSISVRHAGMG
jgi:hypothetical protein